MKSLVLYKGKTKNIDEFFAKLNEKYYGWTLKDFMEIIQDEKKT